MTRISFCFLLLFSILSTATFAQTAFVGNDETPSINVTGTSTLHGWTVSVSEVVDYPKELAFSVSDGASIDNFAFGVVVKSMDGGRGASMNKKIMNALQESKHPVIKYEQTKPAVISNLADGKFKLTSVGTLKMAGKEKNVEIEVEGSKDVDGNLVLKGSKTLKFSDFSIEPPSAMFGQIVCGDDIAINFEFKYNMK